MQSEHFIESVAYLLRETFEGSPEGLPSAFLDRGIGFFNTLAELSADQVSREFGETTIAAQTEHAKFYLAVLNLSTFVLHLPCEIEVVRK